MTEAFADFGRTGELGLFIEPNRFGMPMSGTFDITTGLPVKREDEPEPIRAMRSQLADGNKYVVDYTGSNPNGSARYIDACYIFRPVLRALKNQE